MLAYFINFYYNYIVFIARLIPNRYNNLMPSSLVLQRLLTRDAIPLPMYVNVARTRTGSRDFEYNTPKYNGVNKKTTTTIIIRIKHVETVE